MDIWKFYGITHKNHRYLNPIREEKIQRLVSTIPFHPKFRVLDIACGTAELLMHLHQTYRVTGVGVDLSPYHFADAQKRVQESGLTQPINLIQQDGAQFVTECAEMFDVAMCVGASWIFQGYRGMVESLKQRCRPGGYILVGEPYWKKKPDPEYLEFLHHDKISEEDFGTHDQNALLGDSMGLSLLYTTTSDDSDWGHYEALQWATAHHYVELNPDDPDNEDLLKQISTNQIAFLKWGQSTLGFGLYLFKKNIE